MYLDGMFLKKSFSKNHTYLSLVQSYRENGVVKHKTVINLGRLDKLEENDQLKRLTKSFERLCKSEKKFTLSDLEELTRINWGAERVYRKLWDKFELNNIIQKILQNKSIKFNVAEVIFLEVVSRLIDPCSKLSLYETQSYFHGIKDVPLHNFYRVLDFLCDAKEELEEELFLKNRKLFNMSIDLIFYDVTTLYFESTKSDDLKNFGYSKDCKFGEVQVVLGLMIDIEGRPIGFNVFPGNTFEGKTLEIALKKLKERFSIREVVIVADRGINNKLNLKKIRDSGFHYIVGSRLRTLEKHIKEEVLDESAYHNLYFNEKDTVDYRVLDYQNKYRFKDDNGTVKCGILDESLICTFSSKRAKKDRADRERLILKAKDMLKNNSNCDSHRGAKKYIKMEGRGKSRLDLDKIKLDEKWDGYYGIQSSKKDLDIKTVLDTYNRLWKIEESFRVLKTNLETRPMFHWTPKRIQGHLVLCFISFMLQRTLEIMLANKGVSTSLEKTRNAIDKMQASLILLDGEKYLLRSNITGLSNDILRTLKIKIPKKIDTIENF